MNDEAINILSPDKPRKDPEKEDMLGFSPFAKNLAKSIVEMAPPEGLVIGLHGPWGSGKTTMLNFVLSYIREYSENQQPTVVQFNPWWFSGREDLIKAFFSQLLAALSKWRTHGSLILNKMLDLGEAISKTPAGEILAESQLMGVQTVLKLSKELVTPRKTVVELKEEIFTELKGLDKRILIIIDDIDGLTKDEIRNLFTVIKGVVDFPNTIYLLAFDSRIVAKAIVGIQGESDEKYLQKIVQVPVELPLPELESLKNMFISRFTGIIGQFSENTFQIDNWQQIYLENIKKMLRTPRDISRLTNALAVTYPAVKGEVNIVDFLALESLRLFATDLYLDIRSRQDMFIGAAHDWELDELRSFHENWLERLGEGNDGPVYGLVRHLFPKVNNLLSGRDIGHGVDTDSRKQLRACHPEKFLTYFQMAVPLVHVSHKELSELLRLAGDQVAFTNELMKLLHEQGPDGKTKIAQALEHLPDFFNSDFSIEKASSMLQALIKVGDEILRHKDEGEPWGLITNEIRLTSLIRRLLKIIPQTDKFESLKKSISNSKSLSTTVYIVSSLRSGDGIDIDAASHPESQQLVTEKQLAELECLAAEIIGAEAKSGKILSTPYLSHVILQWQN